MAGEPERAGGSADAALPRRPTLCLARNNLTVRQFGPLESIDPNDATASRRESGPDEIFGKDRWSAASIRSRRRLRARHGSGHLPMDLRLDTKEFGSIAFRIDLKAIEILRRELATAEAFLRQPTGKA